MRRIGLVLLLVLALGIAGLAQVPVVPRSVNVLLFDNGTGVTITKLGIIFDKTVALTTSDVIAFGGEAATLVAASNNFVFIDVVVVPGGTVQITLPDECADAQVSSSFWFE
ncbi:hypothetical protein J7K60_03075 [Candidatus Bipolaricaulota bacterium]|nr:hypothetical protein [Candidatus Bipolaricaulota bacterium]